MVDGTKALCAAESRLSKQDDRRVAKERDATLTVCRSPTRLETFNKNVVMTEQTITERFFKNKK